MDNLCGFPEDRGIVFGLIKYITKNYNFFIKHNQKIIIDHKIIRKIMVKFFPALYFPKKGEGLIVNIKNNKTDGLVLNYLKNCETIYTKEEKVKILPWSFKFNPLIMYLANNKMIEEKKYISWKDIDNELESDDCKYRYDWSKESEKKIIDKYIRRIEFGKDDIEQKLALIEKYYGVVMKTNVMTVGMGLPNGMPGNGESISNKELSIWNLLRNVVQYGNAKLKEC